MHIYSETTLAFLKRVKQLTRSIVQNEMGLSMPRNRIHYKKMTYPLSFVAFEGKNWGYFNYSLYEIGLNKKLIYQSDTIILKNILRHELAHYFCYILYGETPHPHGDEFQQICKKFDWGQSVSRAKSSLDEMRERDSLDVQAEKLLGRVKKLLSLSQSDNPHESKQALERANQLITQYNLQDLKEKEISETCLKRVLHFKRKNAKVEAINQILTHFFVRGVFNHGSKESYLEVIGERKNVEMADYIASFLDHELERLWIGEKKHSKLKGLRAKNSFFMGLASGFDEQMKPKKSQKGREMIRIKEELSKHMNRVYARLQSVSSTRKTDSQAQNLGQEKGKGLKINQALGSSKKRKLLGWSI